MDDEFENSGSVSLSGDIAAALSAAPQDGPRDGAAGADNAEDAAASNDDRQDHGDDAAATPGADRKKPARGVQKRIDELVRQRADATRERDYWREMALRQDLPRQPDPGFIPHASPTQDSTGAGDPRVEADRLRAAEAMQDFELRMRDASGRFDDFDRIALNPDLRLNDAMVSVVTQSMMGPDILYHLGANPREAHRISRLDPLAAAHELGRIEAMLSMPPPRKITGAPPPVRPVGGSDLPIKDPEQMTYEEYKRWRAGK